MQVAWWGLLPCISESNPSRQTALIYAGVSQDSHLHITSCLKCPKYWESQGTVATSKAGRSLLSSFPSAHILTGKSIQNIYIGRDITYIGLSQLLCCLLTYVTLHWADRTVQSQCSAFTATLQKNKGQRQHISALTLHFLSLCKAFIAQDESLWRQLIFKFVGTFPNQLRFNYVSFDPVNFSVKLEMSSGSVWGDANCRGQDFHTSCMSSPVEQSLPHLFCTAWNAALHSAFLFYSF